MTDESGFETTNTGRFGTILVSARGLQKAFHARTILNNVDFDMLVGDITVIIGKSGSAKSTLLRALAGLTEPDEGTIHLDGEVVFSEKKRTPEWGKVNQEIGMIFQTYTLWPHMNVVDNLTLAPRKKLGMSASEARGPGRRGTG